LFRPSGDLVVAISASGETTDTLDAVQCAKDNSVRVIGVTSNRGSTLAKLSDANILLTFPKETSIPATVSMTTSLLALKLFLAARDGRELPGLNELAAMLRTFIADQRRPASTLAQLVSAVGDAQYVAVLGDGAYMGVASEIALKIRETAGGVICEAANLRDYRHGPVEVLTSPVLADAGLKRAAILIEPEVARPQKNLTFFSELADQYRGGAREFTLVRLSAGCTASTDGLVIPDAGEFTPLFGIVLGQMLAYELALAYGIREPGASDVLTKVVVAT
jgi:glucosamine 6-phosphate synthetase-like amidotransferase/phosphosugar isomerase protein